MSRLDELKAQKERIEKGINELSKYKLGEKMKTEKVRESRSFEKWEKEAYDLVFDFKEQQLKNASKHGHLIAEVRIPKEEEDRKNLINGTLSKSNDFLSRLEREIELSRLDKRKIINPLLSSDDSQKQLLGEAQVNSALQYVAITRPMEDIEQDILDALDAGRIDFANKVIESIIGKKVNDKTSRKSIELRSRLRELANELYKETPLSEVELKINQLLNLKTDIKKFVQAINLGQTMYFTDLERKYNPDSIKYESLEQWKKDVEIMND